MKKRLTTSTSVRDEQASTNPAHPDAQTRQSTVANMPDARARSLAQFQQQHRASSSPQAAQLKLQAEMMAGEANAMGARAPRTNQVTLQSMVVVQRAGVGTTVQLERRIGVVGGLEIDLDTSTQQELLDHYKNYFMPSRDQQNYQKFGEDLRAELMRLELAVPTVESEMKWTTNKSKVKKFGVLLGSFYWPVEDHTPAGDTHYEGHQGSTNSRAEHTVMTKAGVGLMMEALALINQGKATFLQSDETYTNVYVRACGAKWGLHLGEKRQIFPISGQGLASFFHT